MKNYSYKGLIPTLAKEFLASVESIRAEHGFDLGPEFEIILCKLLRKLLPSRYGICRGYLTNSKGEVAGDDIVIFDQIRFPTIALRQDEDFSRKDYVPIEAACCYIEAKYTINIIGDDGQSLSKAISQVSAAKKLCSQRTPVSLLALSPHINAEGFSVSMPDGWPEQKNPLFTAIIASQIRKKKGDRDFLSAGDARNLMVGDFKVDQYSQDLCVFGQRLIGIPAVLLSKEKREIRSPFQVYGKTVPMVMALNEDNGFALGLIQIMWALDWIQLGKIPWTNVIRNALGLDEK